ncbi:MAG: DUF4906 domain-containing protein [Bacteroidales bacterium]|nr:DUF4906 domain-containing protein [Bacteroides sp.]MCM1197683.1 DUF4906 domain-containing protein [Clostridium sp.]MCM1501887.1 DUF4906 domain-containing protein [Bacteroidales bacterium]
MKRHLTFCIIAILSAACSWDRLENPGDMEVSIVLQTGQFTKSVSPDEMKISDVNLFVFNCDGLLEQRLYLPAGELSIQQDGFSHKISLLKGCIYSVYACANIGFRMQCSNLEELLEYRYHMAYPDDYRIGIPMCGSTKDVEIHDGNEIKVTLTRAMSKVSVSIDRSALDKDVEFNVKDLRVCSCPKSVMLFKESSVNSTDDIYPVGFIRNEGDASILNTNRTGQTSGEVSLYLMENMQGKPLGQIESNADKVFEEDDPMEWKCSYIELTADYISRDYYSLPGKGLVYRFYIGADASSFDVERNCHYHVIVKPEGQGLPECRWRVDKTGLAYQGETYLNVSPKDYIHGRVGDAIHIRCDYKPEFAPFDIGTEYMEFDHENGIYDYTIDEDGKGFVLKLTGTGSGLILIEAGEPINDGELIVLVVDPAITS